MSQYGALGFAQRGHGVPARSSRTTTRAPSSAGARRPRARPARGGTEALTIGSAAPFECRDATGGVPLSPAADRVRAGTAHQAPRGRRPRARRAATFLPKGEAPLELNGKPYRGQLEVGVDRGKLRAINYVGLRQYLWGVVPDEMPQHWPDEALQGAGGRGALVRPRGEEVGDFDLYEDVRSQVYNGISAEETQTNAAIDQTEGQVLLYGGKVATTYFYSTSGGRTANMEDVWSADRCPISSP